MAGRSSLRLRSTEEDAGFDCRTTASGVSGLLEFAQSLVPRLRQAAVLQSWAGLRPATADRLPYLGRVAEWPNLFLAAGHYRHGLRLAPATARVVAQQMRGETPDVDLRPFAAERAG